MPTLGDGTHGYSRDKAMARLHTVNDLTIMAFSMFTFSDQHQHLPPVDGSADPMEPKLEGLTGGPTSCLSWTATPTRSERRRCIKT